MITRFDRYNPINEKNYFDKYNSIVILFDSEEDYQKIKEKFNKELTDVFNDIGGDFNIGILAKLKRGDHPYIRYSKEANRFSYGTKEFLENESSGRDYTMEKYHDINDLDYVVGLIKRGGTMLPLYTPKKFVKESKQYFEKYPHIIFELNDEGEANKVWDFIVNNNLGAMPESCLSGSKNYLEKGEIPIFIYFKDGHNWLYGTKQYILNDPSHIGTYSKFYNSNDLRTVKNLISNKDIEVPTYEPKNFVRENYNYNLILEKSSLTKLGVPKEVMQPIQRDLALSPDVEWEKMEHKKDIVDYLRKGDKNLFIQIGVDDIKVIGSYPSPKGTQYFVDYYIYRDTEWAGEYEKLKRQYKSLTQTVIDFEPEKNIYRLVGDYSTTKQAQRELIRKEKSFMNFTDKFKTDFLKKFDKILKRISGTNFKKAKEKVSDKAKKIAMENQILIKSLDNPLSGPNGLSILDEFLYQFEDEYSNYFEERIDIQELAKYFTVEKLMTMFMYYIYTGKILVN